MSRDIQLASYTIAPGAAEELGARLSGLRVTIISGDKGFAAAKDSLPALDCCAHYRYGTECTEATIRAAAKAAKDAGAQAVLGIGGGKALDTAKAAGHLLSLPVYTLPTIAATCAAITKLSIVYHEDGSLDSFWFLDKPPVHATLDTALLAAAPARYLRAGIGDAIAKGLEPVFAARGDAVGYATQLGLTISQMCVEPLLASGSRAYQDNLEGRPTEAFAEVLQGVIISTGLVSLLVDEKYNSAVAHSVCYGLDALEGISSRALHGELVAFGCLVQLALDRQNALLSRLRAFFRSLGMPVTLCDFGLRCEREALAPALAETLASPDMRHLPYKVTADMLFEAMQALV